MRLTIDKMILSIRKGRCGFYEATKVSQVTHPETLGTSLVTHFHCNLILLFYTGRRVEAQIRPRTCSRQLGLLAMNIFELRDDSESRPEGNMPCEMYHVLITQRTNVIVDRLKWNGGLCFIRTRLTFRSLTHHGSPCHQPTVSYASLTACFLLKMGA